jgi:glycosyltransferase involved in cell wall biosynthesis
MADVAIVAHDMVRGHGEGRVMIELAQALIRRGDRVTVYAHTLDGALQPLVRHHRLIRIAGVDLLDDIALALQASLALRYGRHDLTITTGPCALPPRPFVVYAHFAQRGWRRAWVSGRRPSRYHRLHSRVAEAMERAVVPRATGIVAVSSHVAADLPPPRRGPAGKRATVVVPNGVDLGLFGPVSTDDRNRARATLGVPRDAFVVAFVGEYHTGRKGLVPLLNAISLGPEVEHLVIAGSGPARWLDRETIRLGIQPRVHGVGVVPAQRVLAAADVAAVPSSYEPYSLVALEAAAMGLPVVISADAGAAEQLGLGAITLSRPDANEMRVALDRLRCDPGLAAQTGRAARKAALRLDWSATSADAATAIAQLLQRSPTIDAVVHHD